MSYPVKHMAQAAEWLVVVALVEGLVLVVTARGRRTAD